MACITDYSVYEKRSHFHAFRENGFDGAFLKTIFGIALRKTYIYCVYNPFRSGILRYKRTVQNIQMKGFNFNLGMNSVRNFILIFLFTGICFFFVPQSKGVTPTMAVPPGPIVSISNNSPLCSGSSLILSSSVSGGTPAYTYLWSGPNSFSSTDANPTVASANATYSGTYFVTVTDAASMTATASSAVTVSDCKHLTMSLQNCTQPSPNIIQFDLYAVSDGSPITDLRANSFQYGINFNTGILQSGATTGLSYVAGSSDFIPPLNGFAFPGSFFPDHLRIVQNPYQGGNTGNTMTIGHQYKVGSFRLTSSANYVLNSNPNFSLQNNIDPGKTVCAAVVWVGSSSQTSTISDTGTGDNQRSLNVSCSINLNTCNLTASISSTPASCNVGSNITIAAVPSGGFTPYQYLWSNSQTTSSISGISAGTYTLTVTDAINCTATSSTTITQPPALSALCAGTNVSCTGNDGSISVSAVGGTLGYGYLWSSGQTTSSVSGLSEGTYTVTVSDTNGCTASCSYTISPCNHITMSIQNCSQSSPNNIQFDLYAVSDGSPGSDLRANAFQYGINFNAGILQSGATIGTSYISGTSDFIPPLNGFNFPTSVFSDHVRVVEAVFSGNNTGNTMNVGHQYRVGRFQLTSSSNWIFGSSPNFNLQATAVASKTKTGGLVWISNDAATTDFSVTGTGNGQRSLSVSCSIVLNTCNISAFAIATPVSCSGGSNGTATASASGGFSPFQYIWNNGQTTQTATGLAPGSYSVTITDAINCSANASVNVTEPSALTVNCGGTNVSCNTGSDGTVSISASGGTPSYNYAWSNGQTSSSVNNLSAGIYSVTVSDARGCTAICSYTVKPCNHITLSLQNCVQTAPNILQFDLYAVSDGSFESDLRANAFQYGINFNTGILQSGASITPSYVNGTSDFIPPLNGFTFPATPFPDHLRIVQSVFSGSNTGNKMTVGHLYRIGTFLLTGSANWINSSSPNFTLQSTTVAGKTNTGGLMWIDSAAVATNFFTTGTGNNQRSVSVSCATTLNTCTVAASSSSTPVTCYGGSNGTATASASGGWPSYNYLWNNGQTTSVITGLTSGSYSVTVTDVINCSTIATVTIVQPTALSASVSAVTNVSCHGAGNGSVSVTASGGTTPYSGIGTFSGLTAGTYSYTVTDAHGCTSNTTVTITEPSALSANNSLLSNVSCHGGSNGSVSVTAVGGTAPYTGTGSFSGLTAGTYTFIVTDAHGCTAATTATINEPSALTVSCSGTNVSCNTGNDGTASISASGGTPSYIYTWSNGQTSSSANSLSAGVYAVTVTDTHGCTASCSFTVKPCNHITLSLQNCVQTSPNILQFDLYVVSDGSFESDLRANSFQYGINFNTAILQSGATITPSYVGGTSDFIPPLNGFTFPSTTFPDHIRIVQSVYSGANTGNKMVVGHLYRVGTFLLTGSANWVNNSSPNFTLQSTNVTNKTNTGGLVWIDSAAVATNFFTTGTGNNQRSLSVSCATSLNTCSVSISASATPVSCFGGSNGTATVSASGGWPPYNYLWSSGQTTTTITGLTAGSYSLTVTDAIGCTAAGSITVTQPTALSAACSGTNASCNGGSNGSASVVVSGGTSSYNYFWNTGATTSSINGLSANTYLVTVTDSHGCTATCSYSVTENPCPFSTLNLTVFLEGPYIGSSTMRNTLYSLSLSSDPTATDTIQVNLWAPNHLSNTSPDYSVKTILHSNGNSTITYPAGVTGHYWYIAVKHRSSIETWSHDSVAFSTTTSYNFSDNMAKAFNNGLNMPMKQIGAVFCFYSGDVNQDGTVDISDMSVIDNDNSQFAFGYNVSDCNGDDATDISDMALVDNNTQLQLFFARPY